MRDLIDAEEALAADASALICLVPNFVKRIPRYPSALEHMEKEMDPYLGSEPRKLVVFSIEIVSTVTRKIMNKTYWL